MRFCAARLAAEPNATLREYEIEAELLHEFRRHGAQSPAYLSIVAAGPNACVLHYAAGDAPLRAGERGLADLVRAIHVVVSGSPALSLALAIARQNGSELHMVSVEEIPYLPEFIEEVRESTGKAARFFHGVLQRARAMAQVQEVELHTHVLAGHPVRDIVELAAELKVDLLVIGATGHSALYERMVGSRADRIMQLAKCPVLVVK